ncbi:ETERODIMER in complex WITH the CAP-Gly domain of P150glued, partial [Yarrowia lipolytica]
HMKVGDRVRVKGVPAHVRFIGPTQFSTGEWIGVEMVEGQGNNDGSVQGVRYFECKGTSGKFVRRPQVETDA